MRTTREAIDISKRLEAIDVQVLQSLFDLTPDVAFFIKNEDGRYIAVNESLIARHGLKRKSDAIGKRPQDICPGDLGLIPTEQDKKVFTNWTSARRLS